MTEEPDDQAVERAGWMLTVEQTHGDFMALAAQFNAVNRFLEKQSPQWRSTFPDWRLAAVGEAAALACARRLKSRADDIALTFKFGSDET